MSSSNARHTSAKDQVNSGTADKVVLLYGALMHPMIIRQTIAMDNSDLELAPATLSNYTRLHIKDQEHSALVPSDVARKIVPEGRLQPDDMMVRGVLVKGLTQEDLERLDNAQGEKYSRQSVRCTPLAQFMPLATVHSRQLLGELTSSSHPSTKTDAFVYTWKGPLDELSPQVWSFDGFLDEKVYSWFRQIPPGTPEQGTDFRSYKLVLGPVGGEGILLPVMLRGEEIMEVTNI
ncbi:hypothetical protein FRB90_004959 [Tulasnella sp. 427]|nr:hypothetical protein FRB90_004959 [Tulasnella sp. 427]